MRFERLLVLVLFLFLVHFSNSLKVGPNLFGPSYNTNPSLILAVGNSVLINGWNYSLVDVSLTQNAATFNVFKNNILGCSSYSPECTFYVGNTTSYNNNLSSVTGVNFSLLNLSVVNGVYLATVNFSVQNQPVSNITSNVTPISPPVSLCTNVNYGLEPTCSANGVPSVCSGITNTYNQTISTQTSGVVRTCSIIQLFSGFIFTPSCTAGLIRTSVRSSFFGLFKTVTCAQNYTTSCSGPNSPEFCKPGSVQESVKSCTTNSSYTETCCFNNPDLSLYSISVSNLQTLSAGNGRAAPYPGEPPANFTLLNASANVSPSSTGSVSSTTVNLFNLSTSTCQNQPLQLFFNGVDYNTPFNFNFAVQNLASKPVTFSYTLYTDPRVFAGSGSTTIQPSPNPSTVSTQTFSITANYSTPGVHNASIVLSDDGYNFTYDITVNILQPAVNFTPNPPWQWIGPYKTSIACSGLYCPGGSGINVPYLNGHVSAIALDYANPNVMYVTSGIGRAFTTPAGEGGIYKTVDDGLNWTPVDFGLPRGIVDDIILNQNNTQEVVTAFFAGGTYKSDDGGDYWYKTSNFSQVTDFSLGNGRLFAASSEGIIESSDFGGNWTLVYPDSNVETVSASGNYVYAMGLDLELVRSNDSGVTWQKIYNFSNYFANETSLTYEGSQFNTTGLQNLQSLQVSASPFNPEKVYVLINAFFTTQYGSVFLGEVGQNAWLSYNGGLNFNQLALQTMAIPENSSKAITTAGGTNLTINVSNINVSQGYANASASVYTWDVNGYGWVSTPYANIFVNQTLNSVAGWLTITLQSIGFENSTPYVNFSIVDTDINSNNWAGDVEVLFDPENQSRLWTMGGEVGPGQGNQDVRYSTDSGNSFYSSNDANAENDNKLLVVNSLNDNILVLGSDQGLYESDDYGASWHSIGGNLANALTYGLTVNDNGSLMTVGMQDYSSVYSNDSGNNWFYGYSGERGFETPNPSNTSWWYSTGCGGNGFGVSNNGDAGFDNLVFSGGNSDVYDTACIVSSPIAFQPSSSTVYVGGGDGVYTSSDFGGNWSVMPGSPAEVNSIAVVPSVSSGCGYNGTLCPVFNQKILVAGTVSGNIFTYDSSGVWKQSSDVSTLPGHAGLIPGSSTGNVESMVVDPFNKSVVFALVGFDPYYVLEESVDGGSSFSIVDSNINFSSYTPPMARIFPARIIMPEISGSPLIVATPDGVFVSTDFGKTFYNMNYNIYPQTITGVVYSDNNLYVSTYGSGVYEMPDFTLSSLLADVEGYTTTNGISVFVDGVQIPLHEGHFQLFLKPGVHEFTASYKGVNNTNSLYVKGLGDYNVMVTPTIISFYQTLATSTPINVSTVGIKSLNSPSLNSSLTPFNNLKGSKVK